MPPWEITGYAAVAVGVLAWLVVSFSEPTPRRAVVEWLGATSLYVALASLFAHLVNDAWQEESGVRLVAFGFLLFLFTSGGVVSLVQMLLALRGPARERQSAVN
jgi:hypothetical protein